MSDTLDLTYRFTQRGNATRRSVTNEYHLDHVATVDSLDGPGHAVLIISTHHSKDQRCYFTAATRGWRFTTEQGFTVTRQALDFGEGFPGGRGRNTLRRHTSRYSTRELQSVHLEHVISFINMAGSGDLKALLAWAADAPKGA